MANPRDVFAAAAAAAKLGTVKPPATVGSDPLVTGDEPFTVVDVGSAPLARFTVACRDGRVWSYPYAYVGLIDCPSGEQLVLHCTCGSTKTIEFRGRGLRQLADYMAVGRVQRVIETTQAAFSKEPTVVSAVVMHKEAKQGSLGSGGGN